MGFIGPRSDLSFPSHWPPDFPLARLKLFALLLCTSQKRAVLEGSVSDSTSGSLLLEIHALWHGNERIFIRISRWLSIRADLCNGSAWLF